MATTVDASIPLQAKSPTLSDAMANMSSLLGVQRQKQQLQSGAEEVQQQQIKTDQDQRMLREQNALAAIHPKDYLDPQTGIIDADRYMKDAMQATPTTGLGVQRATQVYQAQAAQTAVSQAGQDLNRSIRGDVAGRFSAVSTDPDSTYADYVKTAAAIKKDNPQASGLVDSYLNQLKPDDSIQATHAKAQTLNRAVLPVGENQPKPTSIDTGSTVQPGTISPTTGAFKPAGTPVRKDLAPTQQLPYVRSAAAASTGGAKGAGSDEDLYNTILAGGNKSAQIRSLAKDVADLSDITQTGALSGGMAEKWSALKNTLGFKSAGDDFETRRQVLGKMAAQLRIQSEQANGASTDAARSTVESALPHPETMNSAATKAAAQYVAGQAGIAADRATVANKQRKANGGSSDGLRAVDQDFMKDADPNQYIYRDLKPGKERQDFIRQHFTKSDGSIDTDGMQKFKDAGSRLNYHGAQ